MNKNRELKFRAWSTKHKKFLTIGFHIIGETTLFDLLNQHRLEELDTIEITQFTGVKDRKGVEIYEGDILKYRTQVGTIQFFAGMFVCDWQDQTDETLGFMMIDNMEIVGNIF